MLKNNTITVKCNDLKDFLQIYRIIQLGSICYLQVIIGYGGDKMIVQLWWEISSEPVILKSSYKGRVLTSSVHSIIIHLKSQFTISGYLSFNVALHVFVTSTVAAGLSWIATGPVTSVVLTPSLPEYGCTWMGSESGDNHIRW